MRFTVKKVIDFSPHNQTKEVNALRHNDWAHVYVTGRTLTMDGVTYNLNTHLNIKVNIPKNYFGKESTKMQEITVSEKDSDIDSSEDESSESETEDQWEITSQECMSMTTNMLLVAQRG